MINVYKLHRISGALHRAGLKSAARFVSGLGRILFLAYVPPEVQIGEGTEFGYSGIGVVLHKNAVIGRNVLISPGVVIGGRSGLEGVPVIEDDVKIGAGAKVLGPVRLGRGAKIGANAVVITDVPAGATAVGVPAKVVPASPAAVAKLAAT